MNPWTLMIPALLGFGITYYFYGRRIGFGNVKDKYLAIMFTVWLFPPVVIFVWSIRRFSLWQKVGMVSLVLIVVVLRYITTTSAQRAGIKLRLLLDEHKGRSQDPKNKDR